MDEDSEIYKHNQSTLKKFFSNLKTMDACIRYAMLTGVARFSKVSIFSDLNHLEDISLDMDYADICGWTEEELIATFRPGIEALAKIRGESIDDTLDALREFYDGYLFSPSGHRLYNPFSVLRALKSKAIKPYWFETGTPTFLAELVRKNGIDLTELGNKCFNEDELLAIGAGNNDTISLMFQTGYLTIDSYDETFQDYRLRFPNREVKLGFANCLYPLYAKSDKSGSPLDFRNFRRDLLAGDPEGFMHLLAALIKTQPYELKNEGNYHIIAWTVSVLSGTDSIAERHSYKGRSDLEVVTKDYIYVFEFKYNESVEEAKSQLDDRDYAGRFAVDPRPVYLVAANFSPETGLAWQIDRMK